MSKRITLQNILPFVLSGVRVKKSQREYSLKIHLHPEYFQQKEKLVTFWMEKSVCQILEILR